MFDDDETILIHTDNTSSSELFCHIFKIYLLSPLFGFCGTYDITVMIAPNISDRLLQLVNFPANTMFFT